MCEQAVEETACATLVGYLDPYPVLFHDVCLCLNSNSLTFCNDLDHATLAGVLLDKRAQHGYVTSCDHSK